MPQLPPPSARRRPSAKIPSRNDSGESPWKFFEPPRGGIERGVRPQKIYIPGEFCNDGGRTGGKSRSRPFKYLQ